MNANQRTVWERNLGTIGENGAKYSPDFAERVKGYLQWHEWAKTMSKTHKQIKCPTCGLWAIWVPKQGR